MFVNTNDNSEPLRSLRHTILRYVLEMFVKKYSNKIYGALGNTYFIILN
jgi:hypothetical protein